MSQNVIAAQRLYLTADKSALVGEGDERAAFLYASPGDEIPPEAAEKFGLVDGALPGFDAAAEAEAAAKAQAEADAKAQAEKEAAKPADKAAPAPANKGGKAPANKGA